MTKIDIWNAALALLPHDVTVSSEDEDTPEAKRCRDNWDAARLAVLCSHEWSFCTASVPVDGAMVGCRCAPSEYPAFEYPRPRNCIRVLGVYDANGRRLAAQALNGKFVTDAPAASIRYLKDVPNPDNLPPLVQDALVNELAHRICYPVTANVQRASDLGALAQLRLAAAWQADSSESAGQGHAGGYLAARHGLRRGRRTWRGE